MDRSVTIAIVDDDSGVRRSMDSLLRSLGYRVATFEGPEALLASPYARASTCVVSDLRMPGPMDGIALAQSLRGLCPVVLMSAFLDADARSRAEAAGIGSVLQKPFSDEMLIGALARALRRSP